MTQKVTAITLYSPDSCQKSEDDEDHTHYGISQYHYSGCRCVLQQVIQT